MLVRTEDCNNLIVVYAHQCPLLYNRSSMTMAKHLWIISKLLSIKEPVTNNKKEPESNSLDLFKCLQRHVIATFFLKLLHW